MTRSLVMIAIAIIGIVFVLWARRQLDTHGSVVDHTVPQARTMVPGARHAAITPIEITGVDGAPAAGTSADPRVRARRIGRSSLAGRVVDEAGRAVGNARVALAPVAMWSPRASARGTATTGADGSFQFTALPAGAFELRVTHAVLAAAISDPVALDGATARDGIVITMSPGGAIHGRVIDRARQPVAGAHVTIAAERDLATLREAVTNHDGAFEVRGIAKQAVVATATRATGASASVALAADATEVELVIDQVGTIAGVVVDGDGAPLAGVHVTGGDARHVTDAAGAFRLVGLTDGDHRVTANLRRGHLASTLAHTGQSDVRIVLVADRLLGPGGSDAHTFGGVVVANGQPVPNATVTARLRATTRTTTTDASGAFALALGEGEFAVVADEPTLGRSKAARATAASSDIVLELVAPGAVSGVLREHGAAVEGITVTAQSTTAPSAIATVASARDGSFRFETLAADTYKVSATLGTTRTGLRLYSKQVVVPAGGEATVELAVEPGGVTLDVTATASAGKVGAAAAWIAAGAVSASTASALRLKLAAQPGASQWAMIRRGAPAQFAELAPGAYTACIVPLPLEVQGIGSVAYLERHGELAAFCQPLTIAASPEAQQATIAVEVPAYVADRGHR